MAEQQVLVPDIGGFKDVAVIEVAVKAGDVVAAEDTLITVETDKATMDVPSPYAGKITAVKVKTGDKVSEGSLIFVMDVEGAVAAQAPVAEVAPAVAPAPVAAPAPAATPAVSAPVPQTAAPASSHPAGGRGHASPSIRRFARELGVDLGQVRGTAAKGRITKEDVQGYVKQSLAQPRGAATGAGLPGLLPWPEVDFAKFGEVETRALARIKKISGANLHRNWVMIPHVTQFDEADISEMEAFRKSLAAEHAKQGLKITPLAFLLKACAAALQQFPEFNASLDASGENLVLKKYFHIGVAVDTPDGLMVPVIRNVDQKGILQLARELGEISAKARERKLSAADMQGGCFSISSLGGIGGTAFTPIINAPEVAILGVSKSDTKPVWNGEKFKPRLILPLSLSYDHRVIDGAAAARFTAYLAQLLGDLRRAML